MICDSCKLDKKITDFINSKNICYKCLYRIKIAKIQENKTEKQLHCRYCDSPIIQNKNEKKRQRNIFCSEECAQKGHKTQLNNHWTRKIGQVGGTIKWNTNQR